MIVYGIDTQRQLGLLAGLMLSGGVLLMTSGCAAPIAVADAGVTAGLGFAKDQVSGFIGGKLKAARNVTLDEAIHAAHAALEVLQVEIRFHYRRSHDAFVKASAETGPTIKVRMYEKSPVITKYEIKVGWGGDKEVSQLVLHEIDSQLRKNGAKVP